MTANYALITFSRSMADDLDVIRSTSWAEDPNGLKRQLVSEFEEYLDVARFSIGDIAMVDGDTYTIPIRYDLSDTNQADPDAILQNLVETLQRPYMDEMSAGSFIIDRIVVDGRAFETADIVAARSGAAPGI